MTSPFDAAALHARIDDLAALGPNWDSYGAAALDPSAVRRAHNLVDALEPFAAELRAPSVCPSSGGSVEFELDAGSDGEIQVGAWPDGDDWAPFDVFDEPRANADARLESGLDLPAVVEVFRGFCRAVFGGQG